MLMANFVSQNNLIGPSNMILKSSKIILSHNNSHTSSATVLSSTSIVDLSTTFLFLLLHNPKLSPMKV